MFDVKFGSCVKFFLIESLKRSKFLTYAKLSNFTENYGLDEIISSVNSFIITLNH